MNREKWTPEFLDDMARVGDEPADKVVRALFKNEEIWNFIIGMKDLTDENSFQKAPEPANTFLQTNSVLPAWASEDKILKAENLFDIYGPLTITALFCSSLPECYVNSEIAATLHRTGQLEHMALYRVRQTGRFVFSVMAKGGLDKESREQPKGWISGRTQTLVVRIIHSIIRHLIEESPELPKIAAASEAPRSGSGSAMRREGTPSNQERRDEWINAFRGRAGNEQVDAVDGAKPINQVGLAFTLLTFSYVIIRSLRKFGIRWTPEEEEAYMHTWNVVGFILGVHESLMAQSYEDGEFLFDLIKSRHLEKTEAGHNLSAALLEAMASTIRWDFIKPLPHAITRHLIGRETANDLGVGAKGYGILGRLGFHCALAAMRTIALAAQALGRTVPIANWVMGQLAHGMILSLLAAETRTFYAPMQLMDQLSKQPHRIARAIFVRNATYPKGRNLRISASDRRQTQVAISFPDRRRGERRNLVSAGAR